MSTTKLIADLADADDLVRACAAFNLGLVGATAATPALLDLLRSGKLIDRRCAALALGNIGAADALPALRKAAADKDAGVRRFAEEAVRKIAPARRAA